MSSAQQLRLLGHVQEGSSVEVKDESARAIAGAVVPPARLVLPVVPAL